MTELKSYISKQEGFKNFVKALDSYLKAQKFSDLDRYLRHQMKDNPSPISQICLKLPANCAHFEPQAWKTLQRDIVSMSKGVDKIAAIGFDLTGHWEGEGPGFEVSFYENEVDKGFSFARQSHQEILDHAKYPAPWQGYFVECDSFGPIKGLEALLTALQAYPHRNWSAYDGRPKNKAAPPEGFVGYFLGLIFLHLRVQETFARELKQYGLPRAMPVLLGTHDFMGSFFSGYNVLMGTTIARDVISYEQIQAETKIKRRENAKSHAAEQIEAFTKNWVTLRHVNSGKQTEETKSYTEMLTASMRLSFSMSNVTPAKPIHEMKEAEFKYLMESYYQARMQRVS